MALKLANVPVAPGRERNAFRLIQGLAEGPRTELDFIGRRYLLALSRMAVAQHLSGKELGIKLWEAPTPEVAGKRACFVTISASGNLRGCIGSLKAERPLVYDVIENALRAAFYDERFPPLSSAELKRVKFSISVLDEPAALRAETPAGLLAGLEPGKHGLIIRKGGCIATYLPYVWRIFPGREDFLKNLCIKAGLDGNEWKEPGLMEFHTYEAQEFSE